MSYLKRFAVTGSVCPSTRIFGERAAAEVAAIAASFDCVVVAGVGSGVVAKRVLERWPESIFVECESLFAERFSRENPEAVVVTDRIERLFAHLPTLRGKRMLLASFVPTAGNFYSDEIVRFFVGICRSGGLVLQMRYLPHRMSARFFDGMRARGVVSERLFTVARNLPPVSMYGMRSVLTPVAQKTVSIAASKVSASIESIAAKTAQPQNG